jgi:hypothetical protein
VQVAGGVQSGFFGLFQDRLEVNVFGFEVGGVGIGNVARKHLYALAAQSQSLCVNAQCFVNHVHDVLSFAKLFMPDIRQPKELKFFAKCSIARAVPCFSCRFPMGF